MTEDPRETPEYRRQTHEYWEREFGEAVRHIRQKRGWSQRELADRVAEEGFALHQTGIAKIERGARPLRVAEAAAIATVLGIPTLAVFYGVNQEIGRLELEEEANHIRRRIDTARRVVQYAGALYARAEADMVTLVAKAEAAQFDPSGPRPKPGAEFDSVDDPATIVGAMIRTAESDRAATPLDDYGEAVDPLFSASSRPNNLTRPDAPPA